MLRLIILIAITGAAMAVSRNPQRIVGGSPVEITRYPFMANMQYLWWGVAWSQWCGGSLLTSRTVLSAAHCFVGDSPLEWRVRLGSHYAHSGGSVYEVSELVLHEGYNSPVSDNDVAIVRMSTQAVLSDTVKVARIAGPNYNLQDGTGVDVVGWGALASGGLTPEELRHVTVDVINQGICAERYRNLKAEPGFQNWPDISASMICTGILDEGGKDACQGDSGGPVVFDTDVIVGITSWGYGCAHEIYPGVNARVSFYANWIAENGSS